MTLKLSPVHAALRRGAAPVALLIACFLVAQTDDSILQVQPLEQATQLQAPFGMGVGGGTKLTAPDRRVIPLGRRSISVPILMYHYIRTPPSRLRDPIGYNLSVSPGDFDTQMDWLAVNGYHAVDFNDLRAYFENRRPLPSRPVVITLDDGYQDLYSAALPVLELYRFKAVAYVVSGFVGRPGYLTAAEVKDLDRSGFEIASHTVDHADLARASLPWVMYQLVASKASLQDLVDHPVVDFAYPSGKFNAQVVSAVRLAGYDTAVTTIPWTYHSRADRYTWTRVRVAGGEALSEFIRNLGPVEPTVESPVFDIAAGSP